MERAEYEMMAAVEDSHWWYCGMRQIAQAWLDDARVADRPAAPWRSLDAGSGTGGNLAYLLGRYGPSFGLDLAPEAVQLGYDRTPGRLVRGSVLDVPYADEAFDLVTSFEVLYHRAVADEGVALRETWRVLRPGGLVLLRMPAYSWLYSSHDQAVHTRRRYVAGEVRVLLEDAHFVVEKLSYINNLLFPLALVSRLLERLRPPADDHSSAMTTPATPINGMFKALMTLEARWLRLGGTLPYGLSILALGRKPV